MAIIKQLKRIIREPANSPVLIDTNIISYSGENNDGLPKLLKIKRIEDIFPCELKKLEKYLSFVWTAVSGEKKVLTIEEIVREAEDSLSQLRDMYERRRCSYENTVKDALMVQAMSRNKNMSSTLKKLSWLNRYISRLERTIKILEARSQRYKDCQFLQEIRIMVSSAIDKYREKQTHAKISEADISLVSTAFYEALSRSSSPAVISNDKHAVIIANYSITNSGFPTEVSKKLKERVKIYYYGTKSFP